MEFQPRVHPLKSCTLHQGMKSRPVPRNVSIRSSKSSKRIAHSLAYARSRTKRCGSPMVTTGRLSAPAWFWIVCSNESPPLARLPVINTAPLDRFAKRHDRKRHASTPHRQTRRNVGQESPRMLPTPQIPRCAATPRRRHPRHYRPESACVTSCTPRVCIRCFNASGDVAWPASTVWDCAVAHAARFFRIRLLLRDGVWRCSPAPHGLVPWLSAILWRCVLRSPFTEKVHDPIDGHPCSCHFRPTATIDNASAIATHSRSVRR